jgi:hypothetical protein
MAGHCPERDTHMTKQTKKKHSRHAHIANLADGDWGSLFEQLSGVFDWALDIACKLSGEYEEDIDAIENVRDFVHSWIDGRRAEIPITDLLTTLGILFAAIELDLGIESASLLSPLRTLLEMPSKLPAVLRCPGAARDGESTVRIRKFPGRRNASAAGSFIQLAA